MNPKKLASLVYEACESKKGENPLALDIRKLTDIAEFFVLVHGNSDRHVRTLADGVVEHLKHQGIRPFHVEGRNEASWILLDYGAVMVHVFHYEMRKFYNLERLWGDAKIVKTNQSHEKKAKRFR